MSALEVNGKLLDRTKIGIHFYYLVKATHRLQRRDLARRKTELAIKQLKKLSTKELHQHIDELATHMDELIKREKHIKQHQTTEEGVHNTLKTKLHKLDKKLTGYLKTQEQRKKRVQELEEKIKKKFETKQERIKTLKQDYKRLRELYKKAKHDKKPTERLTRIKERMDTVKSRIALLS